VSIQTHHAAVARLFSRHQLGAVRSVEALAGGQLNTALRVNGRYVLRCREAARSTGSLEREAVLLGRLEGQLPTARVVAYGLDELLGEYLLQSWVPGRSLLAAWIDNPDVPTREWWLEQWIEALRVIHQQRFPKPGELPRGELKEHATWRGYIEGRVRKRLDLLLRVPAMERELLLVAERYLRRHAGALEDGPFCLIHRDLHFANVLVEGPHLAAILDFELAESGPPDYELDTIYRFLRYPSHFAEPGVASRLSPARFASVWGRLKRGYPELFNVRHLRQRLCLYALGQWGGGAAADPVLRRIRDIFDGQYGPEP
jgi:aminoglycoside phosphotransferase (APT) family kinase protein